jgi:thiamine-monophosphate kinase
LKGRERGSLAPAGASGHNPGMPPAADRLGEFELIARYFAPLAQGFEGAWGLRDDVAVIAPAPGHELVAKTDAIVGGVHFLPDDPPALVARKALRVNLSDLAAKGAVPRAYLLDLIVPDGIDESWIAAFAAGLAEDQREFGVHLIGGDTDRTPGPVTIAIMALGEVASGRIIRRGGAQPDDTVFVTGTIGDAALGLEALRRGIAGLAPEMAAFLVDRYRLPRPRVGLGPRLIGIAHAALDVSDGLVADLHHLCEVSGLGAVIEAARVPLSAAAAAAVALRPERLFAALTGGDDYEILFAAPATAAAALARLAQQAGVPITPIGRMVPEAAGAGVSVIDASGRKLALAAEGWTHF